jgi:outer membrane protein OmpA-like peptidoglycan-associated protein
MERSLFPLVALLTAAGLACAGPVNSDLERAESEYRAAAADPYVADYAPTQLREAEAALARAQRAFRADAEEETVDHLAYLATRRVEIARATARRNEAFARVEAPPAREHLHRDVHAHDHVHGDGLRAAELAALLSALRAEDTDRGVVVTVDDVLFDRNRAALRTEALPDLSRVADFLRVHPDLDVLVEGHADPAERDRGALDLSLARAESVERYLVAQGIDEDRVVARGFGASDPAVPTDSYRGRQQNRRVEIVVVE